MSGDTSVGKEPCPKCGSVDNLVRYDDGHAWCFTPGCEHYEPPTDGSHTTHRSKPMSGDLIKDYEYQALSKRRLSEETTTKWKYGIGTFKGKPVQIANYFKDGRVVAQKVRFPNKEFLMLGDGKDCGLYGQHLWREGGKNLCITEGEIDAMSVSQLFGNKWPVVSIPRGAQGAAKAIKQEYDWVNKFEQVILMFDNDDAGRKAAEDVAAILPPGKVKIAELPLKDPNAMLQEGRGAEVVDAFWAAKPWRPDGILRISDLKEQAITPIQEGAPWPWTGPTEATHGRRPGQLIAIGAGTGIGKTDVFTQMITFDAMKLGIKCGVIYLEQPPVETVRRLAGKLMGKKFHIPGADWTTEELVAAIDTLDGSDNIVLYNHFGVSDWETIEARIRYMAVTMDCQHIYLDHLTALAAHAEDERRELEALMADLAGLAQELGIIIHFISHLATPEGKPHEEGGRVFIRHFKGARAIGFWSHLMIGLERDQQSEDERIARTTVFRILKDRYGTSAGYTTGLYYVESTGILEETALPKPEGKGKNPFADTQEDF